MLTLETTRFGKLEIEENRIIHFPEGLLGFPDCKDYVILDHKPSSPFCWLQSTFAPDLAFVMTNPFLVKKDYLEDLSREEEAYFESERGDVIVFALVTVPPGKAEKSTVNLLGPLVIDMAVRTGRQVVLANAGYSHSQPLTGE